MKCQDCQMIELYLFYKYLALRQFREAGPKYPISCAGKVIQSLQLQISHQMRPYSNVKAIRGSSSYTCLRVFGHQGNLTNWRHTRSNPKSSAPHSKSNEALFQCQDSSEGPLLPALQVFGHYRNLGKLDTNTPHRHTKSNSGSSHQMNPYSKCQGHLMVELNLFQGIWALGHFRKMSPVP